MAAMNYLLTYTIRSAPGNLQNGFWLDARAGCFFCFFLLQDPLDCTVRQEPPRSCDVSSRGPPVSCLVKQGWCCARRRLITLASLALEKKRRDPCKFNALTPKNKSALWASLTYIGLTKHLDHLWGISVCLFACACACVCLHVCNFEINLHCRTWLAHSLPKTDWLKGEKRAFSPKNIHPFYIFHSVTKSTLAFLTPTLFKYWLQLVQNILSVMVFKRIQETFPQQLNLLDFNFLQFVKASCI